MIHIIRIMGCDNISTLGGGYPFPVVDFRRRTPTTNSSPYGTPPKGARRHLGASLASDVINKIVALVCVRPMATTRSVRPVCGTNITFCCPCNFLTNILRMRRKLFKMLVNGLSAINMRHFNFWSTIFKEKNISRSWLCIGKSHDPSKSEIRNKISIAHSFQ